VRYWPTPYHPMQRKTPFHQRLRTAPETEAAREREERQAMRLLYVGWTRARDRVVLAGRPTCLGFGMVAQLQGEESGRLLAELAPTDESPTQDVAWAGRPTTVRVRHVEPVERVAPDLTPGCGYAARESRGHPPAVIVPSALVPPETVLDQAVALEQFGERLILGGNPDIQVLGAAIHCFLAADRPSFSRDVRRDIARGLLQRWGIASAIDPDALVQASDQLRQWTDVRFPGAVWHREWPLLHRLPNGTIVRGTADLVLEHATGLAVVDHKSFPGTADQAAARALTFTGQLRAYAAAASAATGRHVTGCFVHLPVLGAIVPLPAA
jgi:ATP-dependent helicase/nuclease subunit A